jgi:hypothetical protein
MSTSHTELTTFRRCPREHFFSYILYREPVATPKPLEIGKRVDLALKTVMLGGVPDLSSLEPMEQALVIGWTARWRGTLEVERVDVPFKVRLGSVEVVGEIDAIGILRSPSAGIGAVGRRVLIECKTTSEDISPGSGYWKRVTQIDVQATIYLAAARELGLAEPFLLWDVLRKPTHRQKVNETDNAFAARVLGEISEDLSRYYQRCEIVRHDEEHAASVRDIEGIVHLMQVTRTQLREAPRNVDACMKFGRPCPYLPCCDGETTIDDPIRYKKKERRTRTTPVETKPAERERFEF